MSVITESVCQNDYSCSRRSRSPSPEPITRSEGVSSGSASIGSASPNRIFSPSLRRRLENIRESPPPPPEPVALVKEKILAPPMHYDLHKADAVYVYSHIKDLTKNDPAATEYLEQIKPAMFMQPKPVVFGYIPAPPIEEITKQVIGAKGYFFKMTTVVSGVYFIWHDTDTNTFLFWGPSTFKVVKAMNSIRWRIFKHCEAYNAQQPVQVIYDAKRDDAKRDDAKRYDAVSDDDTDDDMPDLVSLDCEPISQGSAPDHEHPEQS